MTTAHKISWITHQVALVFVLGAAACACKLDSGGGEAGEEGTGGGDPCACLTGFTWNDCICVDGHEEPGCYSSSLACDNICSMMHGGVMSFGGMSCSNYPDSGSCSGWNPASHISLISGVRYMDHAWIGGIIQNPAPTWTCDDAYLDDILGGKFKVKSANSGELLYELGLRNNDIPQTLNGYPLENLTDGFDAWQYLWLTGESDYDLYVKRGTSYIHLYYNVFSTL